VASIEEDTMQEDTTLITFVLDESGSMGSIAQAARDGFNEYLEQQTDGDDPTLWTLTTFTDHPHTRFAVIPGSEVRPLGSDYQPHGVTALYDAVGRAITKTRDWLAAHPVDRPGKVVFVILTDGMENASKRWTSRQVFDLISEAESDGWQFMFLGANQDSWSVAEHLGIRRGAVVDWSPNEASYRRAMYDLVDATDDYRRSGEQQRRYRDRR